MTGGAERFIRNVGIDQGLDVLGWQHSRRDGGWCCRILADDTTSRVKADVNASPNAEGRGLGDQDRLLVLSALDDQIVETGVRSPFALDQATILGPKIVHARRNLLAGLLQSEDILVVLAVDVPTVEVQASQHARIVADCLHLVGQRLRNLIGELVSGLNETPLVLRLLFYLM